VIEKVATRVLTYFPSTKYHRVTLVNELVKELEYDAEWVRLYDVTGELNVPGKLREVTEDLQQLLEMAKKVTKCLVMEQTEEIIYHTAFTSSQTSVSTGR
jgi:hypothetical protein